MFLRRPEKDRGDPGVKQTTEQTVGDVHVETSSLDIVATSLTQHTRPRSAKPTISESQAGEFSVNY